MFNVCDFFNYDILHWDLRFCGDTQDCLDVISHMPDCAYDLTKIIIYCTVLRSPTSPKRLYCIIFPVFNLPVLYINILV